MFVSRLIEDIPKSLKMLLTAIMDKPVKNLDIKDNAVGVRVVQ